MIEAVKGGPLGWALDRYVGWKIRSAFRGLWVRGELPGHSRSFLVYMNHPSWWDGFVLHQLGQVAGWDAHCIMEEENLERYRFLSRIGAFSIRKGEGASALESLRYARKLLERPGVAVGIFPEGELKPFGSPLVLERGVEVLARVARAECLPVAMRYVFLENERPDILVEVGQPHPPAPLERFQRELRGAVERLAAVTSLEGFTRRVRGSLGVAERWDAVRGRRVES